VPATAKWWLKVSLRGMLSESNSLPTSDVTVWVTPVALNHTTVLPTWTGNVGGMKRSGLLRIWTSLAGVGVGEGDGVGVGAFVGVGLGVAVGVGLAVGALVGVGLGVGARVGVGVAVGGAVGPTVGLVDAVGRGDGVAPGGAVPPAVTVGPLVGDEVGVAMGPALGDSDGSSSEADCVGTTDGDWLALADGVSLAGASSSEA
jgi:hypothetical protein